MSLENIILHERSQISGIGSVRTSDTFVLTKTGWKLIAYVKEGDEILSYSLKGSLTYDTVMNNNEEVKTLVRYHHSFWGFCVGSDHRWLGYRRMTLADNKRIHIWDRRGKDNLTCEFHIINTPRSYINNNISFISEDECSLLGWLLSDGYIKWSLDTKNTSSSKGRKRGVLATVTQNDNKYGKEIKDLMLRLGGYLSEYKRKKVGNICRNYYLQASWFREYWGKLGFNQQGKFEINLVEFLLNQPTSNIESFMDAFQKADGHYSKQGKKIITQNESNISEGVLTACYLLGYNPSSGSKGYYQNKTGKINRCMWYKFQTKPHQTTMRMKVSDLVEGNCTTLTMQNSDCIVVRQGDFITLL